MMKRFTLLVGVCLLPLCASAQLFEPGNFIFADPFFEPDGQIVELDVDMESSTASIVNVVRWPLPDETNIVRRRALGLDVDPAGNVWVGITKTESATAEFPTGTGEALPI